MPTDLTEREEDRTVSKARVAYHVMAAAIIVVSMAGITVVVFISGTRSIAVHFYYLPIIYAAVVFGDWGAALTSVLAALLCGPWIPARIDVIEGNVPQELWEGIPRLLMFFVVAMVASRTSNALKRRIVEAHTLYEVAQSVASTLRINRLLTIIADHAVAVMHAKACAIRLLDKETGELRLAATSGLDDSYWSKGPVSLESSPLDTSVIEGDIVQIADVSTDARFQYSEKAREAGITSVLTVPLKSKDESLGVIRIYSRRRRQFRQPEIDLLTAFAHQAATGIENAQLYEDLHRSYYETMRALTRTIEAKDSSTYSHSERVCDLAVKLGRTLGMGDEEIDEVQFGCILHDIGKIGLDEQVIDARDNGDSGLMFYRMHPLIGRTILQPVSFLQPSMDIVVHHHESWDGSGFPEGLKGETIPLHARITAICDGYDRLLHPSSLDSRLTPKDALQETLDGAGSKYDPRIVAAFRRMMLTEVEKHTQP
jgi:putative nucleotidyltransferase with HDIG domain